MDDHDALIDNLSRDARPVRRPLAPGMRTVLWTAAALPLGALSVVAFDRAFVDWSAPAAPWAVVELVAAFVLGALGILSAFRLTQPGRKAIAWQGFAAVALVWLAATLVSLSKSANPWGHPGSGQGCYLFMVAASLPMVVLAVILLNRTRTLYPWRTLGAAGLGIAFMTATLMSLCHPPSGELMDIFGHVLAGVTIVAGTVLGGKRLVSLG